MNRRGRILLVAATLALIALSIAVLRTVLAPDVPRFQVREVRSYAFDGQQPTAIYGDCQVEADAEYNGPSLFPTQNSLYDWLRRLRILRRSTVVPSAGDVVLLDERGRPLATLAGDGPAASATSARFGYSRSDKPNHVVFLWNFVFPAGIDRSRPIRFSTTVSIEKRPPQAVEVTIPPRQPPAR